MSAPNPVLYIRPSTPEASIGQLDLRIAQDKTNPDALVSMRGGSYLVNAEGLYEVTVWNVGRLEYIKETIAHFGFEIVEPTA